MSRTLYLLPTPSNEVGIYVITDSARDKLTMTVFRPSGALACNRRGPDSAVSCFPTVLRRGNHVVRITNPLRRAVRYKMECLNAP